MRQHCRNWVPVQFADLVGDHERHRLFLNGVKRALGLGFLDCCRGLYGCDFDGGILSAVLRFQLCIDGEKGGEGCDGCDDVLGNGNHGGNLLLLGVCVRR
ncbi:MAG: hypothetical protein RLZZ47_264 [Bacteroidota bacterium]